LWNGFARRTLVPIRYRLHTTRTCSRTTYTRRYRSGLRSFCTFRGTHQPAVMREPAEQRALGTKEPREPKAPTVPEVLRSGSQSMRCSLYSRSAWMCPGWRRCSLPTRCLDCRRRTTQIRLRKTYTCRYSRFRSCCIVRGRLARAVGVVPVVLPGSAEARESRES
jgi:hypothetical protein